jgi:DNA invertase Pin-like site-specific DNA recombinase
VQEAILALVWGEHGKAFSAEDGEIREDDDDDPMRTAIRQMRGVFSELDRRTIVKRLRDGRRAKAAEGKHAVGVYAFGTQGIGKGRDRDAGENPDERAAVQRIVELRRSGASYRDICAALNSEGLKPRRAAAWQPNSVRNVALRAGCS